MQEQQIQIGIIGLGYLGLPLAVELARYFQLLGSISTNPG